LEIFDPSNYILAPAKCTGIFSVGQNLYINTLDGIMILPGADPNAITYVIEPRWHFANMRTVCRWNNGVIGLTNDGVRLFDGDKFTNFDLAYPIKSKVERIYSASPDFLPCAYIYRRGFRNEYHLLWQDTNSSDTVNNTHAILNLDSMYFNSPVDNSLAWDFQPVSGNYAAVNRSNNQVFIGQSHENDSRIYMESSYTDQNNNVYDSTGALLTVDTSYPALLRTRVYLPNMNGTCWLKRLYLLAVTQMGYNVKITIYDKRGRVSADMPVPLNNTADAKYDDASYVYDTAIYPYDDTDVVIVKLPDGLRGKSFFIDIYQTQNDPNFQLMSALLLMDIETGNFL
jgi:hypothetical protein